MGNKIFPFLLILFSGIILGYFVGKENKTITTNNGDLNKTYSTSSGYQASGNDVMSVSSYPISTTQSGGKQEIKTNYLSGIQDVSTYSQYRKYLENTLSATGITKSIPYFTGIILYGHSKPYFLYQFYNENKEAMDNLVKNYPEKNIQTIGLIEFFQMCQKYNNKSGLIEFFQGYDGGDTDFLYFKEKIINLSQGRISESELMDSIQGHLEKRKGTNDYPFMQIYDTYLKETLSKGSTDCGTLLLNLGNIWSHGS